MDTIKLKMPHYPNMGASSTCMTCKAHKTIRAHFQRMDERFGQFGN